MRKLIISIILTVFVSGAFSQMQLTQFFLDGQAYNPAYAGSQDALCANSFGRKQWLSFTDENNNPVSPFTMVYNVHAPIYGIKSGLGVNVLYDKLGLKRISI
jgi:hypothetical protein